jgi:hypothetical protein
VQVNIPERQDNGAVVIPKCWICMDLGFVLYKDEKRREFLAHCTCPNGSTWAYDGSKCENRPSPYYAPSAEQKFDTTQIAKTNFLRWWKAYKDKPGVRKELERRGLLKGDE